MDDKGNSYSIDKIIDKENKYFIKYLESLF